MGVCAGRRPVVQDGAPPERETPRHTLPALKPTSPPNRTNQLKTKNHPAKNSKHRGGGNIEDQLCCQPHPFYALNQTISLKHT